MARLRSRNVRAQSQSDCTIASGLSLDDLNFHYRVEGDRPDWRPVHVFDDGTQVFIQMPDDLGTTDAPPLFVLGTDGGITVFGDATTSSIASSRAPNCAMAKTIKPSCASSNASRAGPYCSEAGMADPIPFEEQAEALKLRAKPRPVTQINRKVVMAGAGIAIVLLFLAASVALDPPKVSGDDAPRELYNTSNRPTADALAALPSGYYQLETVEDDISLSPRLGPPNAGDLGGAFVQAERDLGIDPTYAPPPDYDFRPDPVSEAERAERIRQARLIQDSLESPVFFQINNRGSESVATPASTTDPFAALAAQAASGAPALPSGPASQDPNLQSTKIAFAG